MKTNPIDINLADLVWGARGRLRSVLEQINDKWIGKAKPERAHLRCGSVTVTNDTESGNGRVVIDLRFPLDLQALDLQKKDSRP